MRALNSKSGRYKQNGGAEYVWLLFTSRMPMLKLNRTSRVCSLQEKKTLSIFENNIFISMYDYYLGTYGTSLESSHVGDEIRKCSRFYLQTFVIYLRLIKRTFHIPYIYYFVIHYSVAQKMVILFILWNILQDVK